MDEYHRSLLAQPRSLPNMQHRMSAIPPAGAEKVFYTAKAPRPMDTHQEYTATQKRISSTSHERLADTLSPPVDDTDTYRLMVLRSNETEEELDRKLDRMGSALGLRSPQDMNATLDLITHDASALDLRASPENPSPLPRTHSRTSRSANTPSASSVESKESKMHRKTPSLAATSTATSSSSAPSVTSDTSLKSNYVRFKDSMKRMSTIGTKRKALSLQPSMTDLSRPPVPSIPATLPRSNTADQIMRISDPQVVVARNSGPNPLGPPWQVNRRQANSMAYGVPPSILKDSRYDRHGPPPPPSPSPAPPTRRSPPKRPAREIYPNPPSPAAIARSQASPSLNALRGSQLQEQVRFITFRASQTRLMRKSHASVKDCARTRFRAHQADLERGHAAHLARLEESHLSAELDLEHSLAGDRQACDARIRHMQAYISGPPAPGMPRRQVTAADREKLELEVHGRGGMDNLHAGKIEVLRGQQEQQLERVGAKHEVEMAKMLREYRSEKQALRRQREEEEQAMEGVFADRKRRMVARWGLAEAIERRTLEIEIGEQFAPLPVVGWGDFEGRDAAEEEERYVKKVMGRGGFKVDEETGWMVAANEGVGEKRGEDVTARAGVGEYDAENMI